LAGLIVSTKATPALQMGVEIGMRFAVLVRGAGADTVCEDRFQAIVVRSNDVQFIVGN
jgi:hypothetical protein